MYTVDDRTVLTELLCGGLRKMQINLKNKSKQMINNVIHEKVLKFDKNESIHVNG
jgi:hypothetical protein